MDRHDFSGIFLGYTATDNNIRYLDLDSGVVKLCHHAMFDEAWYLQPSRSPAAQLLHDLGHIQDTDLTHPAAIPPTIPEAHCPPHVELRTPPPKKLSLAIQSPLPICLTKTPPSITAATAAKAQIRRTLDPYAGTVLASIKVNRDGAIVSAYDITRRDIEQVYISPHPYNAAFKEKINLRRFNSEIHPTAGFKFKEINGRLTVGMIATSTPAARIPRRRS